MQDITLEIVEFESVRILIGNNPREEPVYRVTEVVDVCETAKVYDVMKGQSRTNVGLKLKFGKSHMPLPGPPLPSPSLPYASFLVSLFLGIPY